MPIETMKFYFTGIQHLNDGTEVGIPLIAYDHVDEYKARYNQEWNYAYSATDTMAGLTIVVFDSTGVIVFQDHWMREVEPENNSNE